MALPDSFAQELLNRIDVIDIIDKRVQLKKRGANFIACCPFHDEKTPSFTVSPSKQFYHCFGCGASGDAIQFLIEYEGLTFIDSITELAGSIGLKVPTELLSALPYLATIFVLVLISQNRQAMILDFPVSLAKPFRPKG